jgi:5'-3' exonuclease
MTCSTRRCFIFDAVSFAYACFHRLPGTHGTGFATHLCICSLFNVILHRIVTHTESAIYPIIQQWRMQELYTHRSQARVTIHQGTCGMKLGLYIDPLQHSHSVCNVQYHDLENFPSYPTLLVLFHRLYNFRKKCTFRCYPLSFFHTPL